MSTVQLLLILAIKTLKHATQLTCMHITSVMNDWKCFKDPLPNILDIRLFQPLWIRCIQEVIVKMFQNYRRRILDLINQLPNMWSTLETFENITFIFQPICGGRFDDNSISLRVTACTLKKHGKIEKNENLTERSRHAYAALRICCRCQICLGYVDQFLNQEPCSDILAWVDIKLSTSKMSED